MTIEAKKLRQGLDQIAADDPQIRAALAKHGYPQARGREPGYGTLLRTIVGQQVSSKAAASVWKKLENELGDGLEPHNILNASEEQLRACGLSRQKIGYAKSLASAVAGGNVDLNALAPDDEAAIAQLVQIKGIGRWSAEIYLLFAHGRPDIWPAGDLALQIQLGRWQALEQRPNEKLCREIAEKWSPWRGVIAIFAWHVYNSEVL